MWRYWNHKIVQWCWSSCEAELITDVLNEYYADENLVFESIYQSILTGGNEAYLVMIKEDLLNQSHHEMYDIRKVMVNTLAKQLRETRNESARLKYRLGKTEAG